MIYALSKVIAPMAHAKGLLLYILYLNIDLGKTIFNFLLPPQLQAKFLKTI